MGHASCIYKVTGPDGRAVIHKSATTLAERDRIIFEANVLGEVQHHNIVRRIEFDRDRLVLEYIDGEPLRSLYALGELSFSSVTAIARGLFAALSAVHDAGYVHCDVSPNNVMITADGDIKLIDFGLARRKGTSPAAGRLEGTPPYISPEQVRRLPLDERADLYAAGVILYELYTGQRYRGNDRASLMRLTLLEHPAPAVRNLRPEIPVDRDALVSSLMATDRSERPADAHQVLAALSPRSGDESAHLLRDMAALRSIHSRRRRRRYGGALIAVALSAGLSLSHAITVPKMPESVTRLAPMPPRMEISNRSKSEQRFAPRMPAVVKRARPLAERPNRRRDRSRPSHTASNLPPKDESIKRPNLLPVAPAANTSQDHIPTAVEPARTNIANPRRRRILGASSLTAHCYGKTNVIIRSSVFKPRPCPSDLEYTEQD